MDSNSLRGNPTHLTLFYSKRTGDIKKFTTGITDLFKAFGKEEGEELSLVYDTLLIEFDENIMLNYKDYKVFDGNVISKKITLEQIEILQGVQDDKITTTMLANTELFEMLLALMPMKTRESEGDFKMVEVYVTLIIDGHKTLEEVPTIIRSKVKERLIQLGIPGYEI